MQNYYSNGKLLLTGEYVVLDGALSLAIPTRYGQSLTIEPINDSKLIWESFDEKGKTWFKHSFLIENIKDETPLQNPIANKLKQILKVAQELNTDFLNINSGFKVTTALDFPRNWGLGTSSTLINNIANWTKVDAYKLLQLTFGGSGYDIACAQHNQPITYQLLDGDYSNPNVVKTDFNPSFKDHLYFVYLNQKQDSRKGIAQYRNTNTKTSDTINAITNITEKILTCSHLNSFENLIYEHELIISELIQIKPIKELLFSDFTGSIKSLGAWGGDFVLVTSEANPKSYFEKKGFNTIIPYSKMILK